ncbi:MAG: hypothetical protein H6736_00075 [Alphaproteobacteria bacterium]|nr:hypothetical protein [Alphaproteobacteria bacterium]MCB9690188.1 hypothetical protein [Alphaproteobacteria bacterium]
MLLMASMVLVVPRSCSLEPVAFGGDGCDLGPFARASDQDLEWNFSCWTGPVPVLDTLPFPARRPDRAFSGGPRRSSGNPSATHDNAICALRDPARWQIAHVWLSWEHGWRWMDDTAHWNVFNGLRMDDGFEPIDREGARACLLEAWSLPEPDPERCGP